MSRVSVAQKSPPFSVVPALSPLGGTPAPRRRSVAANAAQLDPFALQIDACAEAFPSMQVDEFEALKASIARNGVLEPILVWQGRVMDGRHRLNACKALGIAPMVQVLDGTYEKAKSEAFSTNINRRHLGIGQRAILAAQLATRKPGQTKATKAIEPVLSQEDAARLFAVGRDSVQKACRLIAHGDTALLDQVHAGTMSLNEAITTVTTGKTGLLAKLTPEERQVRRQAKAIEERLGLESRAKRLRMQAEVSAKNQALPVGQARYSVLLADPPWDYGMPNDRAPSRMIPHEQYPTMTTDAICEMDVETMAADDAMLYLWCPATLLPEGLRVMQAWGFKYVSNWVWHKTGSQLNCGGGTAMVHHELLLVGKRGNGLTIADKKLRKSSVLAGPVAKHSAKPGVFHEQIEALYPDVSKFELFSRAARPGWTAWGNQAETSANA